MFSVVSVCWSITVTWDTPHVKFCSLGDPIALVSLPYPHGDTPYPSLPPPTDIFKIVHYIAHTSIGKQGVGNASLYAYLQVAIKDCTKKTYLKCSEWELCNNYDSVHET